MKYNVLLCLCFIFLGIYYAKAQSHVNKKADSLLLKLKTAKPCIAQFNIIDGLYKDYWGNNVSKALDYANIELLEAIKLNYPKEEVSAYTHIAKCYARLNDNAKAINNYQNAYSIAKAHNWIAQQNDLLFNIGVYERLNKNYIEALKCFNTLYNYFRSKPSADKSHSVYGPLSWRAVVWQIVIVYNQQHDQQAALSFLEKILDKYQAEKNRDGILSAKTLIADYYGNINRNYSVAINKQLEVLKYYKSTDTSLEYAERLMRTGYIYENLNKYDKAIEYFEAYSARQYKDPKEAELSVQEFLRDIRSRTHDYQKSLQFDLKEARTDSTENKLTGLAYTYCYLSADYLNLRYYRPALYYAKRALSYCIQQYNNNYCKADILIVTAQTYYQLHDYKNAFNFIKEAEKIATPNNGQKYRADIAQAVLLRDAPGTILAENGVAPRKQFAEVVTKLHTVLKYAIDQQDIELARDCYKELSTAYELKKNYKLFHDNYLKYIIMRDSVTSQNSQVALDNKLQQVEFSKQADSLKFHEQITQTQLKAKQTEFYYAIAGLIALVGMSFLIMRNYLNQRSLNNVILFEKQRSDDLLLNILPADVAEELKEKGSSDARLFDEVTVLFTDFVNFTTVSELLTPQELVNELNVCFKAFDGIMTTHQIEKIKTVGDAYLAVSGLPLANVSHAANVIRAAQEIQQFMLERKLEIGIKSFGIRIGVHSGSVVAGIVGVKKFAYDIWGDTVNTAARMEQNCEAGKINVSEKTYELVKDQFAFTYRGEIAAKNKGMMKMYFAE